MLVVAGAVVLLVALPRGERPLRVAAALFVVFCLATALIDSPVGGNSTRLGALFAAPLFALGAAGRRPQWVVAVALVPLLYWQWVAPVRDLTDAVDEPSVEAAYYAPLLDELAARAPGEPFRVQVPPTRNRWEAVHVAPEFPLARGWLRQLESDDFARFQDARLDAAGYRRWLDERATGFVAVSTGAEPDYLARDEIALIDAGLPYLHEVWRNTDWTLYEVADRAPFVTRPARVVTVTEDGFELRSPAAGAYLVRVRFSPYFEVTGASACIRRAGDWTRVELAKPGIVRVDAGLSLRGFTAAIVGSGEQCSN